MRTAIGDTRIGCARTPGKVGVVSSEWRTEIPDRNLFGATRCVRRETSETGFTAQRPFACTQPETRVGCDESRDAYHPRYNRLFPAGGTKTAGATLAGFEIVHDGELRLHHRYKNHLCNAVAGFDGERVGAAVPYGHKNLTLVVRVDQADEVSKHDAVLVAESRARKQNCREVRIGDVHGETRGDEMGLAGCDVQVFIQAGAQVEAGGAGGGVLRKRKLLTDAPIEDFEFDLAFQSARFCRFCLRQFLFCFRRFFLCHGTCPR
jgi:hypothetical protein